MTISALGAATIANGAVRLPISGGIVGPKGHNGVLLHKGGVKFTSGAHLLSVRGFVLTRIDNRTLLSAIAGGKRLVLARVTKVSETTTGTQTVITGELSLSAAAARAINHLLGQNVVSAGVDLGSLKSTVTVA